MTTPTVSLREIEPLKVNGVTLAEIVEGQILIIDRVYPEEALALHAWLSRALGKEPTP